MQQRGLMQKRTNPVWVHPWGYTEGFLIAGGLLMAGFALEWATPDQPLSAPAWPWNAVAGVILLFVPAIFHIILPKHPLIIWMSRIPASIGAIAAVVFTVLLMGLFAQGVHPPHSWMGRLGLHRLAVSWPFLMSIAWFLLVLGMATVRRVVPFRVKNIGFLLNHFGLWLVIAGGLLGSGDLKRVTMTIQEGQTVWYGSDRQGHTVELPLALELIRFHKDEYPPKMGVLDHDTGRLEIRNERDLVEIERGGSGEMAGWAYQVREFYPESVWTGSRYEPAGEVGAAPAALVEVFDEANGDTLSGWISCGSFAMEHRLLELNEGRSLAMTVPQARRYMSVAQLYTRSGRSEIVDIEVNRPVDAEGWKLYQYSYDDRYGKWSPVSVIEAVRDPWLPVVYTGFVMMLLGAVYIFWTGREMAGEVGR
jgi:hypothetical protein